jgi:hypothetical protein
MRIHWNLIIIAVMTSSVFMRSVSGHAGYFLTPGDLLTITSESSLEANAGLRNLVVSAGSNGYFADQSMPSDLSMGRVDGMPDSMRSDFQRWEMASARFLQDMGNYYNSRHTLNGYTASPSYQKLSAQLATDYYKLQGWIRNHPEEFAEMFKTFADSDKPVNAVGWRCNYKGVIHSSPYECANPGLGGVWFMSIPSGEKIGDPEARAYRAVECYSDGLNHPKMGSSAYGL